MVLPVHPSKIVDWSITIPNKNTTEDNVTQMLGSVVKDHSRTPSLFTHPYLKENPKRQTAKAERGRIHDVGQSSAPFLGSVLFAPPFGTVPSSASSSPPFGTVPSTAPLGTVTSVSSIGTVPPASLPGTVRSTPPLGTASPNGFISNFLHYNNIMQNFANNGPAANILSAFQFPPPTSHTFSFSDLPTTSNTPQQQLPMTPMMNQLNMNPDILKQIDDLLTPSVQKNI